MPEPSERLSGADREKAIRALRRWASRQPRKRKPVIRLIDGAALTAQDLLDEPPPPRESEGILLNAPETSRAWRYMLNLVAVSLDYGESLDEIIAQLEPEGSSAHLRGDAGAGQ